MARLASAIFLAAAARSGWQVAAIDVQCRAQAGPPKAPLAEPNMKPKKIELEDDMYLGFYVDDGELWVVVSGPDATRAMLEFLRDEKFLGTGYFDQTGSEYPQPPNRFNVRARVAPEISGQPGAVEVVRQHIADMLGVRRDKKTKKDDEEIFIEEEKKMNEDDELIFTEEEKKMNEDDELIFTEEEKKTKDDDELTLIEEDAGYARVRGKQLAYEPYFNIPGKADFAAFAGNWVVVQHHSSRNVAHKYNLSNPTQAVSEKGLPTGDDRIWSMSANNALSSGSGSALHWWSPTAPRPPTEIITREKDMRTKVEAASGSHALIKRFLFDESYSEKNVEFHIVDFSPNGSVLTRTIVRGTRANSLQCPSEDEYGQIRRLSYDGETVFLLCPKAGALYIWSRKNERVVRKETLKARESTYMTRPRYDMACSKDGKSAFIVQSNGDLWSLDLTRRGDTLRLIGETGETMTSYSPIVRVSDDGRYVLTVVIAGRGKEEFSLNKEPCEIRVWKLGKVDPVFRESFVKGYPYADAAISGDGRFLLVRIEKNRDEYLEEGVVVWKLGQA